MAFHNKTAFAVLLGVGLVIAGCGGARSVSRSEQASPADGWSESVNGLQARIRSDRAVYHPGEELNLWAEARNDATDTMWVRASGELHAITPDGTHLVHESSQSNRAELPPGWTMSQGNWTLRSLRDAPGWRLADQFIQEWASVDLTLPGPYTFWHEHSAAPNWLAEIDPRAAAAGAGAWTGRIASPALQVEVRDLPDQEKVLELTEAQQYDLGLLAEGLKKHDDRELVAALQRLEPELMLARNVGLADAAADVVVKHYTATKELTPHLDELYYALSHRAVDRPLTGGEKGIAIRGRYVRSLAEMELRSLDAFFAVPPPAVPIAGVPRTTRLSIVVLVAVCVDSPDEPLRRTVIDVAAANARLPDPLPWKLADDEGWRADLTLVRYYQGRLSTAWHLLRVLDALDGKTEAEVIAILGEPTYRAGPTLGWSAESQMHVNPHISVTLKDGKVVRGTSGPEQAGRIAR